MASYRIEKNAQYNSNEIYFDSKPAAEVLTALRGLKRRRVAGTGSPIRMTY